ncbi:MAG: CDP-diacylglycerol--serine O-phosphatidyltransferase [Nitrospirales bacterium]|nr:CDP-diacylglycerol--serine O-phosphatidyltransferase [Nitrospirales bacterium]
MRGSLLKSSRNAKEGQRRRGVYLIPNILTTGNLFSGLASVVAVFHGKYELAAIAILIAMIFDTLDGTSARLMKSTSEFGVQYDSLSDLISFGVAPGILIYVWGLESPGLFGAAVMFAYVACGALRLARFNVTGNSGESKHFIGLPIPAAAGLIATSLIVDVHVFQMASPFKALALLVVSLTLSFLMVSRLKYRSLKELQFHSRHHFMYLVWAVLILVSVVAYPQLMLFVVCAGYALSGMIEWVVMAVSGAFGKRSVAESSAPRFFNPKE